MIHRVKPWLTVRALKKLLTMRVKEPASIWSGTYRLDRGAYERLVFGDAFAGLVDKEGNNM